MSEEPLQTPRPAPTPDVKKPSLWQSFVIAIGKAFGDVIAKVLAITLAFAMVIGGGILLIALGSWLGMDWLRMLGGLMIAAAVIIAIGWFLVAWLFNG